jgi:hypothetical protein
MQGKRPWKVDYPSDSTASDVVVVPLFGHVDGEERMLGDFGVDCVLAPAGPYRVLEVCLGDSGRGQKMGSGTNVFVDETLVLRHQR